MVAQLLAKICIEVWIKNVNSEMQIYSELFKKKKKICILFCMEFGNVFRSYNCSTRGPCFVNGIGKSLPETIQPISLYFFQATFDIYCVASTPHHTDIKIFLILETKWPLYDSCRSEDEMRILPVRNKTVQIKF